MRDGHVFNIENDSEMLAMDIIQFLQKWGMWRDVQIFTGGKSYSDNEGEIEIRDEAHPEKYLEGAIESDCDGNIIWKDFSNPERFLDMTFEGPLSQLLRYHEYEVEISDVSEETKRILAPDKYDGWEKLQELVDEYFKRKLSWDPAEFDSYSEWLELNQYYGIKCFVEDDKPYQGKPDFSSSDEYEGFLTCHIAEREAEISEYFEDDIASEAEEYTYWPSESFYDNAQIASVVIEEFIDLLEKYGLWYDLGFSWSLTTYRI